MQINLNLNTNQMKYNSFSSKMFSISEVSLIIIRSISFAGCKLGTFTEPPHTEQTKKTIVDGKRNAQQRHYIQVSNDC